MSAILVVDDECITHRIISVILGSQNHTVLSAFNGLEALQLLDKNTVDLVLTDIRMPIMDGLTLIERLRANERYQETPIVIISASPEVEISLEALRRGATAYLSQPFSSWELIQVVSDCLSSYALVQVMNQRDASLPLNTE